MGIGDVPHQDVIDPLLYYHWTSQFCLVLIKLWFYQNIVYQAGSQSMQSMVMNFFWIRFYTTKRILSFGNLRCATSRFDRLRPLCSLNYQILLTPNQLKIWSRWCNFPWQHRRRHFWFQKQIEIACFCLIIWLCLNVLCVDWRNRNCNGVHGFHLQMYAKS